MIPTIYALTDTYTIVGVPYSFVRTHRAQIETLRRAAAATAVGPFAVLDRAGAVVAVRATREGALRSMGPGRVLVVSTDEGSAGQQASEIGNPVSPLR
jgi:hypothetical protein